MLDPDDFRSVLGRFASGVTIVTARTRDGRDHGITVTAFCSLSLAPPLVLVCIDRAASMHDILGDVDRFAVNFLDEGQETLSRRFSGPDPDRFEGIGFSRGNHGLALLADALAHLECRFVHRYDGGDHSIYVAEVESAVCADARPLLYYRGGYAQMER